MKKQNEKPTTATSDDDNAVSRKDAYEALEVALANAIDAGCFEQGPKWAQNIFVLKKKATVVTAEGEEITFLLNMVNLSGEARVREAGQWTIREFVDTLRFKRTKGEAAGKWAGGLRPRACEGTLEVKYAEFEDA